MNTDLKNIWTTALRSGNYKQARNELKRIDYYNGKATYCCLGVLCAVAAKDGQDPEFRYATIRDEYGVSDEMQAKLANLNDCNGSGFPAIADWIDSHL